MQTNGYREMIDQNKLQRLQDEFCKVTGVCAFCLDRDGSRITQVSGSAEQVRKVQEYEKRGLLRSVLERVEEGSLEEQAVESLGEAGDLAAAISIKLSGKALIYWMVVCTATDGEITGDKFQSTVDLLWDASRRFLDSRLSPAGAEAESRGNRLAEQEMERALRFAAATAEMVQLLDSNDRQETVAGRWLDILARYLEVDTALLFQVNPEKNTLDVLNEWCASGHVSYFDRSRNQTMLYPWLLSDKPLVYSYDAPEDEYTRALKSMGVTACMIFPVLRQADERGIILTLNHRDRKYSFNSSEIRFAADAVKVLQSILTSRTQKNSLESSYETLKNILDNVVCGIYVTDEKTRTPLFVNRSLQHVFAVELNDGTFENLLRQGEDEGKSEGSYEIYYDKSDKWYDLVFKNIAWVGDRAARLYSLYDITDKKLYQRRIEQQANTDFLTGLYNRMCCERDLARKIDQAKRAKTTGALLYLDLDDFKHINDGLGHQYGDALLKAISHALQRIRGIETTCYRVGGDEFIIVIPPEAYADFDRIVADIREIFAKPWFLKNADYYCTMSMGVVTYPDLGDSVADLIKKADISMFEAKKAGKNRIARYKDGLNSASGRRLDMEKNMRDATADNYREFEIYYQPIIDVQAGQEHCTGAEALIRWNSVKLGFIPPDEFIPLAEYLGLINPIGNYVMKEACLSCKRWNENGYPDYKVNVNLSVVQLLQADVVEIVERTLEETGLQPRNLTLEVTESLAINDMVRMKQILNRIKALGVKIALDDFGTGYSSLNHIREIPFDVIKVDQSFVKDLAADAYSQSFVKMVAELAETLGVSICVEGIETAVQYDVVQHMKVKYIQGYFFDRPMKKADFEAKYCGAGSPHSGNAQGG